MALASATSLVECSYVWEIDNFSLANTPNSTVYSPVFTSTGCKKQLQWRLSLFIFEVQEYDHPDFGKSQLIYAAGETPPPPPYPGLAPAINSRDFRLSLEMVTVHQERMFVDVSFSILDKDGNCFENKTYKSEIVSTLDEVLACLSAETDIMHVKLQNDGQLTIECKLSYTEVSQIESLSIEDPKFSVSCSRITPQSLVESLLVECSYVWKIDNYFSLANREDLYSPVFTSTGCNQQLQWRLKLVIYEVQLYKIPNVGTVQMVYTDGAPPSPPERIYGHLPIDSTRQFRVNLEMVPVHQEDMFVDVSFSILDKAGNCVENETHKNESITSLEEIWTCASECDIMNVLQNNGQLTIECELSYTEVSQNILEKTEYRLYESLIEDPKFSDVTIRVGSRDFQSHRAILATASPVFEAMFRQEQNKEHHLIEIEGVKTDVMEQILKFVYTGKVSNDRILDEMAQDLFVAADRYQLDKLKALLVERHLVA